MSNKPKEFWICRGEHVGDFDCRKPFYSSVFTKEDLVQLALAERERTSLVQVVDKASYDQVCKERLDFEKKWYQSNKELAEARKERDSWYKANKESSKMWVNENRRYAELAGELEKWKSWALEARERLQILVDGDLAFDDDEDVLAKFPGGEDG